MKAIKDVIKNLPLNANQISTDPEIIKVYGKDWTTYFDIHASAVIFPESTNDVSKIVKWAVLEKVSLVPSGGRTGLSGGACALNYEVVVSFDKMNQLTDFNSIENSVRCQAGVITEQLQNYAKSKNLFYPVDFAARGSSQIGGNIATNAGGIKVLRYGLTRDWITSLTVVTGTGEILELNKSLIKNATGYDLRHLFIGSEGTLGFITEATIQLTTPPPTLEVLLLSCENLSQVIETFKLFNSKTKICAFEMISDKAMLKVLDSTQLPNPFTAIHPFYIVVEIEKASEEESLKNQQTLEEAFSLGFVTDGLIAQSDQQAKNFWRYREDISESLAKHSPYKNDISVRISFITEFIAELEKIIHNHYPDWTVVWFGHVGDGNLHLNILRPPGLSKEEFVKECQKVDVEIFTVIKKFQGSISAEHGVGLTKRNFLNFTRSPEEIQILKQIKNIFDPHGIINPGKLI
ncbi:MAG: FAD-binding oxidoreductase [Bdellovibrionaceae bacterium]|nr:FAD-binding oxidoreductase [Pseudobdellovibrionaceae bacterium]NUM58574.1 FAD-binding oxidoreductase [Pseudobdellovibrionaceae bacterium]